LASVPWGKLLAGLAIAYGAWIGFQKSGVGVGVGGGGGSESYSSGNITTAQLAQLAANTPSSDIVMYSATWCPNCTQAKSWMAQYGFKPQVCETDKDSACQSQLKTLDPQGGVPYLIVKGHHMKDGFDSQEFVAALVKQ
jgi:glutaredoxin